MLLKLREAILQIDKPMIREWVEDLVLVKTFTGLCFQEALLGPGRRNEGNLLPARRCR